MEKFLLIINAGSSSIKFSIYKFTKDSGLSQDLHGEIDSINDAPNFIVKGASGEILVDTTLNGNEIFDHKRCLTIIYAWLRNYSGHQDSLVAVGHRVVHGGINYTAPVLVDDGVIADLEWLIPLAPLHQPHNLLAIRAFKDINPHVPQIACFDTAFHATQPQFAQQFALPRRFFDQGVRRYGFHGISYEYITSILPTLDTNLPQARVIVAHLGNGASLCAINKAMSVATTMGFSPLDGLVMGSRCGQLDPGVILHLLNHCHMDAEAIELLLYHESGLLGVSGISSDMRKLVNSRQPFAQEAVTLFVYRIVREIGSLTAALGGLDALIFTGGIGEHSPVIRSAVASQLGWLGFELDNLANQNSASLIATAHSKISAWVVKTDENLMIARCCRQLLNL
jgi:acetate kinase